ncbi:FAD-dependent monooxygenase [Streptomyces sp. NBC_01465]|uniref:FAD-dependent monooxygenase n=1 Tax=Streptomyces sp. NBC_01465 TaxID=2903878 RepID=UPI002E37E8A9|nr:FAD-dependent monooxygenase [Streptomyces sp. NBC_01465]
MATEPSTTETTTTETDVLVVGAGPTGLLLAGDLATAGLKVTLVERRPHRISNLTRAFAVHARTLEALDARGLADDLIKTGHPTPELRVFGRLSVDLGTLRSRFPFLLTTPQYEVERLLERRAVEAGVDFRYERELTALTQTPTTVTARLRTPDGTSETTTARYAIGADGHRSAVREALGIPFPGKAVLKSIVLADLRLTEPPKEVPLLSTSPDGDSFTFIAPFGDGYYRVIGWDRNHVVPDTDPVDFAEIRTLLQRTHGTDLGAHDARWLSRFHSDERQAPRYREGRVFLAGDAAHVHSPAGGQGLNTGLQDAANLSWKLARVLTGQSPEALLDTYQSERHPVGAAVLRTSGALVRLASANTAPRRALRTLATTALKYLAPARRRMAAQISGTGIAYAKDTRRVPDLALANNTRLYEALRAGKFVEVTPLTSTEPPKMPTALQVHWQQSSPRKDTLLVRPDGYTASPALPL